MLWILSLLRNPVEALDLKDSNDRPDHGKIMGFVAFIGMFSLSAAHVVFDAKLLPLGHMIALGTLAFGWPAWRTFLRARTVTITETLVGGDMYNDDERGAVHTREEVNPNVPVGFKI